MFDLSLKSFLLAFIRRRIRSWWRFSLVVLMFSASSCWIVVLCWVVVDIFVLLDFLSISVLLRLRFNMSEYKVFPFLLCGKSSCSSWTLVWLVLLRLYLKLLYFLNFRCCKTFLVESSFAFISVWMAWYWLCLAILFRELSVFLMSCALFYSFVTKLYNVFH